MGLTLHNIVSRTLLTTGFTIHWYEEFLHHGIEAMEELEMDTYAELKVVKLKISDGKVKLPRDYVDYVTLGTVKQNGRVRRYTENPNLAFSDSYDTKNTEDDYYPFSLDENHNDLGEFTGRLFGAGGFTLDKEFRVNRKEGYIRLGSEVGNENSEIYLEYVAEGDCPCSCSYVHPYLNKAIEKYIIWMNREHNRSETNYGKETSRREYYNELRKARARISGLTYEQIIESARAYTGLSTKF